ncbi:hypothetical protein GGR53DRAFT_480475 [Hypoxylon sp. FL1150]|nr:hypothetical protein GGR53DRAFT_480475 [Hypoxylon sp. FL1150]
MAGAGLLTVILAWWAPAIQTTRPHACARCARHVLYIGDIHLMRMISLPRPLPTLGIGNRRKLGDWESRIGEGTSRPRPRPMYVVRTHHRNGPPVPQ